MDRLAATLFFDEPVGRVKLVSPARAKALEALGISTVRDLLTHYPRRYVDLSVVRSISDARIGEQCTIRARVQSIVLKRPKPKLALVEISVIDDTGILIVTAFRQPWLIDRIAVGSVVAIAGCIEFNYGYKRMTNPFIEVVEQCSQKDSGVIFPVHPACEKISTAWMRRLVGNALESCEGQLDPMPISLRSRYRLMSRSNALRAIHFPHSMKEASEARRRLAFEELLLLELAIMKRARLRSKDADPVRHCVDGSKMHAFSQALSFVLTEDQMKARDEVLAELNAGHCANHLLLGDVGTGKTVIAGFAAAAAADTGMQCMIMAPTEVLAQQHAQSLGALFDVSGITWEILTGSTTSEERSAIIARIASGTVDVTIGTHALLEPDVRPARLSVAIIDEQQRFGVEQRSMLLAKGTAPDAVYLTATPIPRTLALALYGDLTLSYLTQKPHRTPSRKTIALPRSRQGVAYDAATAALGRGEQVYVVCPLVGLDSKARDERAYKNSNGSAGECGFAQRNAQESDRYEFEGVSIESDADYTNDNVKAAMIQVDVLRNGPFHGHPIGLLHGKMASAEKESVMRRFREGEVKVLVTTTVIEVGVDVPNATVMIIEDADRFGLSQLHQLRGRVGRGEKPGEVYLISNSTSEVALDRLSAMQRTEDGFELASYDLSLRREGDILGNRQHGAASLKLVNVVRDGQIIEVAHRCAQEILEIDPELESDEYAVLAREMRLMLKDGFIKQGG